MTSSRPRNSQYRRTVRASAFLIDHPANQWFDDLKELEKWVASVAKSPLFESFLIRAGIQGRIDLRIGDGRGRTTYTLESSGDAGVWEAKFPQRTRSRAHALLILPWLIVHASPLIAWDGPEVAQMRLDLVNEFLPAAAGCAYQAALQKEGVSHTSVHVWPGGGTAVVQSVALREHLRARGRRRSHTNNWSGRPRDSQRARLYRSEREVSAWGVAPMQTIAELREFVRRVEGSALWDLLGAGARTVRVGDGRGGKSSRACPVGYEVHMRSEHRFPMVVLHELAHLVTPLVASPREVAAHGPEFVAMYHIFLAEYLGRRPAEEFRGACRRHSVRLCEETMQKCRDWLAGFLEGVEYLVEPADPHPWAAPS